MKTKTVKVKSSKGRQWRTVKVQEPPPRKVLGVTANVKNILLAVALLVAFLGTFWKVYNYIDETYARLKHVQNVKLENDYRWETTILNGMYSRYCTLDNLITFTINPSKVDPDVRKEWNELKAKIKLQEEKVKELQHHLVSK